MPRHYKRALFDKLQNMKQSSHSVEEYYKEMELAMIQAKVQEQDEQTMARFILGLNHNVKRIVNFQPYNNLYELVHHATKAERQLQEDAKFTRSSSFAGRTPTSGGKFVSKSSVGKSTTPSGGSSFHPSISKKVGATPNAKKTSYPTASGTSSVGSTAKSSVIQGFKCLVRGHMQRDCPNNKAMLMMDNGDYDSTSEDEGEQLAELEKYNDAHFEA